MNDIREAKNMTNIVLVNANTNHTYNRSVHTLRTMSHADSADVAEAFTEATAADKSDDDESVDKSAAVTTNVTAAADKSDDESADDEAAAKAADKSAAVHPETDAANAEFALVGSHTLFITATRKLKSRSSRRTHKYDASRVGCLRARRVSLLDRKRRNTKKDRQLHRRWMNLQEMQSPYNSSGYGRIAFLIDHFYSKLKTL